MTPPADTAGAIALAELADTIKQRFTLHRQPDDCMSAGGCRFSIFDGEGAARAWALFDTLPIDDNQKAQSIVDALNNAPALVSALRALAETRGALEKLNEALDFSEPLSEDKPWIFEDPSDVNAAFGLARAALARRAP